MSSNEEHDVDASVLRDYTLHEVIGRGVRRAARHTHSARKSARNRVLPLSAVFFSFSCSFFPVCFCPHC